MIHLNNDHPSRRISRTYLKIRVRRLLKALSLPSKTHLGITFVDDAEIAKLNQRYLRHRGPTDVISFPMGDVVGAAPCGRPLGDIVISLDTAARQAAAQGISACTRHLILIIHGLLHLLGYDHQTKNDYEQMHAKEKELIPIVITTYRL